jgi:hypothetical protein
MPNVSKGAFTQEQLPQAHRTGDRPIRPRCLRPRATSAMAATATAASRVAVRLPTKSGDHDQHADRERERTGHRSCERRPELGRFMPGSLQVNASSADCPPVVI